LEEELLVGEIVENTLVGEVVEDVFDGEVVQDVQPAAPPARAVPPPLPQKTCPAEKLPEVELLRRWDFKVHCRKRSGLTSPLHYEISDADTDEVLGDAAEQTDAGTQALKTLFGLRANMAGSLLISDAADGESLLIIERGRIKPMFFTEPCTIKLYGPSDYLLAWFKAGTPMLGGLGTNWNADCWICDDRDNEWANITGNKYTKPDYTIRREDGKGLARVKAGGKWNGFFRTGWAWTDHDGWLDIALNDRVVKDRAMKLILLGSIVAYESIIANLPQRPPISVGT
jgi:hypothetical protein